MGGITDCDTKINLALNELNRLVIEWSIRVEEAECTISEFLTSNDLSYFKEGEKSALTTTLKEIEVLRRILSDE